MRAISPRLYANSCRQTCPLSRHRVLWITANDRLRTYCLYALTTTLFNFGELSLAIDVQCPCHFWNCAFHDVSEVVIRSPKNSDHDARPFISADFLDFLAHDEL